MRSAYRTYKKDDLVGYCKRPRSRYARLDQG